MDNNTYDFFDSTTIPGCEMQVFVEAPIPSSTKKVPVAIGTLQSCNFEARTQIKQAKSIGRPYVQVQPGFTQVKGVLTFAELNSNALIEILTSINYIKFDDTRNYYVYTEEMGTKYVGKEVPNVDLTFINSLFKGLNLSFKYVGVDNTGTARVYKREIFGIVFDSKASASGLDVLSNETEIAFTARKYRNFHK